MPPLLLGAKKSHHLQMHSIQGITKAVSILFILGAIGCGRETVQQPTNNDQPTKEQATNQQAAQAESGGSDTEPANDTETSQTVKGQAAWYGPGYYGKKTTSGEILEQGTMTAAHSSLPMGTKVRVTRVDNNKSVTVVINDRKPFKQGTVIDLAHGSATALNVVDDGKATVEIEVLD